MIPLKADASCVRFLKEHEASRRQMDDYNPYVTPLSSTAVSTLDRMRPWRNVAFSGNDLTDFLSAATTESAIRKIIADTSHAGGVRVRFLLGATYANLVKVLGIMNYTNQKKYFLDIHHRLTTLYAITDKPSIIKPPLVFSCGTRYIESYPPPRRIGFQEMLTDVWKKLLALVSRPWQTMALWLAILSSLSLRQLVQLKLGRND